MAGNPTATTSSALSPEKFNFSPDYPSRITLTSDQVNHCSRALNLLKEKLHTPHVITQEFSHLQANRITPSEMRRRCTLALDAVNSSKNRYSDVLPFDNNRVVLKSSTDYRPAAQGYINASFVSTSSPGNVSQFIATQGPLPHTYEDFWEMIIQYHCPAVIMLTRLVDNYQLVKCGDYFQAEDGPREVGNISIIGKWVNTTETSLVLRHLEVNHREVEDVPLSVLHIQYPEWPDHGVPKDTFATREILKRLYHLPPNLGPIVVHLIPYSSLFIHFIEVMMITHMHICLRQTLSLSAGIGRTGTYCTIHNTIQRILAGDMSAVDIANTIAAFRSQRIGMVQTKDQYIFCYKAIIDELEDLAGES
ncbi:Protein-tyrosine-phosphatase PTP1 [Mucuna pruriens]|uniref:Protein-tyrosine-phosphatase PTP1 n=1 Tax=Mucuna pruriens TaxID=157652 RepID=A0A371G8D3_MUCPR|nr:Protein-tyrosine-phosphatase PTP1 [Mucuna pruriens]